MEFRFFRRQLQLMLKGSISFVFHSEYRLRDFDEFVHLTVVGNIQANVVNLRPNVLSLRIGEK